MLTSDLLKRRLNQSNVSSVALEMEVIQVHMICCKGAELYQKYLWFLKDQRLSLLFADVEQTCSVI